MMNSRICLCLGVKSSISSPPHSARQWLNCHYYSTAFGNVQTTVRLPAGVQFLLSETFSLFRLTQTHVRCYYKCTQGEHTFIRGGNDANAHRRRLPDGFICNASGQQSTWRLTGTICGRR